MHQQNALHCHSSFSVFAVASLCTCSVAVIMNINVNNSSSSIAAVLLKPVLQIPHHCTFWMSPSWSHPIQVFQSLLMSSKMCSSGGPQDRFEKHCHSSSIYLFFSLTWPGNSFVEFTITFCVCRTGADSLAV